MQTTMHGGKILQRALGSVGMMENKLRKTEQSRKSIQKVTVKMLQK